MRVTMTVSTFGALILLFVGNLSAQDEKKVDLKVGDTAPVFSATDDQGKAWKTTDLVGKKFVVVYFYPADFTSGCRAQAQKFRDNMNALNDQGIEVVGISGDSVVTHALFKEAEQLNFTLKREITAARWTFIIGLDGKILYKNTRVNPVDDSKQVAEFIDKLQQK